MSILFTDAIQEQLPATDTTVYICPSTASYAKVTFANCTCEDATGDSITINIVQSGGSVAATNQYLQTKAVTAGETDSLPEIVGVILMPGDFVSATAANADRLNLKLSIQEVYN